MYFFYSECIISKPIQYDDFLFTVQKTTCQQDRAFKSYCCLQPTCKKSGH